MASTSLEVKAGRNCVRSRPAATHPRRPGIMTFSSCRYGSVVVAATSFFFSFSITCGRDLRPKSVVVNVRLLNVNVVFDTNTKRAMEC